MVTTNPPSEAAGTLFPETHWSAVRRVRGSDKDEAKQAVDMLCATYWKPIFTYINGLGENVEDAKDLTQEFFRQLMVRRNLFAEARSEQGRLRSYVCVAVRRMVVNERRKRTRLKRGGKDATRLNMREELSEEHLTTDVTPETQFDRRWASALIKRTLIELETDYVARDQSSLFEALRPFISLEGGEELPQSEVAATLGLSIGALRMNLSRLRKRFGIEFRRQVAATVPSGSASDIDAEIGYLIGLFE